MFKPARTILAASLAATLALGGAPAAFAAAKAAAPASPTVYIDGVKLSFASQQPVVQKGRTLVPMRAIFEALGATIKYDGKTGKVTATKKDTSYATFIGDKTVTLTLGSTKAHVKAVPSEDWEENAVDKDVILDVPAQTVNGSTMVPLAFIGQALDCHVKWDGAKNRVTIYKPQVKEYWYQQDSITGELRVRYDLDTYRHPDPIPVNKDQVYLRTIGYGDQKAVAFYSYLLTRIPSDDEQGEPITADVMVDGKIENGQWTGDYVLSLDDPATEEWDYSVDDHIVLPAYVTSEGKSDLSTIPFSVYAAIYDADQKGLLDEES